MVIILIVTIFNRASCSWVSPAYVVLLPFWGDPLYVLVLVYFFFFKNIWGRVNVLQCQTFLFGGGNV